jgi:hypothetical protein
LSAGGLACVACSWRTYFLAASLRCQVSSVAGVTGKTWAQRLRGTSRASAANQARSAGFVPHPVGVPAQYRVLMPEHEQLSILRHVTAEHQDGQAEHPAGKQVDDLEQHPPSQPSPHQTCWRKRRPATQSSIRAVQAWRLAVQSIVDEHNGRANPPPETNRLPPRNGLRSSSSLIRQWHCLTAQKTHTNCSPRRAMAPSSWHSAISSDGWRPGISAGSKRQEKSSE